MDIPLFKVVFVVCAAICGLLLLASCKFADLMFYEHQPSEQFYNTYDIDAPEVRPFIDRDVLFTVALKGVMNESHIVWLGLSSEQSGKEVLVKQAVLEGNNWSEPATLNQRVPINEQYTHEDLDKGIIAPSYFEQTPLLSRGSIKLFYIEDELLEKAYQDGGDLRLKVSYEIDGKEGVMEYELKRRVEKQNIYPT